MKKYRIKIYIAIIAFFIVTFAIFALAYIALSQNFINTKAGENLTYMADKVAVEFNLVTKRDYYLINDTIEEIIDTETIDTKTIESVLDKVKEIKLNNYTGEENPNTFIACYTDDLQRLHIDDKVYTFNERKHDDFLKDKVCIVKLSSIFIDCPLDTTYMFFRYGDLVIGFPSAPYLDFVFKDITGMPENIYMVIDRGGNIISLEDSEINDIKFYLEYTQGYDFKYKYDDVASNLANKKSGFEIFNIKDVKSYFIYSPVLEFFLEEPLFISYSIEFSKAMNNVNYLRVTLLIVFGTVFILFNSIFALITISYAKKEQDVSLSRINHYFIKPFSILVNRKGKILSVNKSFSVNVDNHTRYKNVNDIVLLEEGRGINDYIKTQQPFTAIMESVTKMTMYVRFIPVKTGLRYCLLGEDATSQVDENIRNKQIALYNPVTNLPNRNVLNKTLTELCEKHVFDTSFYSLIAIDITDFGKVNRIFGYSAADKMLKETSKGIKESLQGLDGEVYNIRTSLFMVLIKRVPSFNEVIVWSKKCLEKLEEPMNIKSDYLTSVEVKMGIYNIEPTKIENLDEAKIYECANTALDRAKNSRLTRCAVYSSEFGRMLTRDQIMEEDLKIAIEKQEFVMYYQAQYNTKQKRVVGFEALLRWNNPKYKLESVEHFVSIAEKNGMIVDIGHIIIEETFKFAKSIEDKNVHISMNVSPVQLLQSGFVNELIESFNRHELKQGSIAIEITETFLMENSDQMISKLKLLREKGFEIHLDDFGIGYSSMLYLKDLPVDLIKIDKEFIKHVLNDKFSRIIVTKIVQIALNLELKIIAEGVETEKQRDLLSRMGCNIIQGYLISKPVPEIEALALIEKNKSGQKMENDVVEIDEFSDNVPDVDTNETETQTKKKKS